MLNVLQTSGLSVTRSGRQILSDISIALNPGEVFALVGPNGSGKSTLLRCLAGLWQPTEGQVMLGGKHLKALSRSVIARSVAYVPQETAFTFTFSVREIVLMGRYAHRGRFDRETSEDRSAAQEALERADVVHVADRSITDLSGGERQRVLIARSLATRAQILLFDEPTASLDIDHGLDVLELCSSLAEEGRAVVIATHDLNAVCRYADRVALIEAGRFIGLGNPSDVLTNENLQSAFRVRPETLVASDGTPFLLFHRLSEGSKRVSCYQTNDLKRRV